MNQRVRNLAVGVLGTATVLTLGLPQQAQAVSLSYAYSYQEIRNFNITGLGGVTGLTFQPTTTSRAIINNQDSGSQTNATDVGQAISSQPSQTGLGNNVGFFPQNTSSYFNTQYRTQEGVADFSRGDAIIGYNNGGVLTAVTGSTQLTTKILGGANNGLVWAGVAESLVALPASNPINGNFLSDVGNAVGSYSIASSNFNVTNDTPITFDFQYLNAASNELTDSAPAGAPNTNLSQARYNFKITINEVDSQGNVVNTPFQYDVDPTKLEQQFTDPVAIVPYGLTNISGLSPTVNDCVNGGVNNDLLICNIPLMGDLTKTITPLTNGNSYNISISSEQVVDTRVQEVAEIPEPSATIALLGLGLLGLIVKRN